MEHNFKFSSKSRYPKFEDYEIRYSTFSAWNNPKNPHELVKSGFSFIGGRDNVQCFHCGIILNNWSRADDVDFCHKTSSPNCGYIKSNLYHTNKGTLELISSILSQLRDLKDKVAEIQELLKRKEDKSNDYKLFDGIQLPGF